MKNTLLHAVSHDLKGPLAGVLGAMQTIRRAEKLHLTDKEMNDLYGVIEQAGAKAARLVEDLLDLDRLDRGQLEPQREPTDVVLDRRPPGRRAADPRRTPGAGRRRTRARRRRPDDDRADRREPAEQRRPAHAARARRSTSSSWNGRAASIVVVEDEGPGVPDEMKATIFEPFRRERTRAAGVGIGLSLVGRFAELHGGSAHVEDRDGGGARFIVVLPGRISAAPPIESPADLQAV